MFENLRFLDEIESVSTTPGTLRKTIELLRETNLLLFLFIYT